MSETTTGTLPTGGSEGTVRIQMAERTMPNREDGVAAEPVFQLRDVSVHYGDVTAVDTCSFDVPQNDIVALIGPSGCGKSTVLRSLNRMNDLVSTARVDGRVLYHGHDLYADGVDPVEVRRRIGMVFQQPNPFPKSIYENVAFGPKINGFKGDMDELVERSLVGAALWDEVKDKLHESGLALSGGQQQRLEDLMRELKKDYTIVIVTHNMQQAARVSDRTAFFTLEVDDATGKRAGTLVEYDRTDVIFTRASDPRTESYISGRFG
jgi:phosphate transport system ATP-binding protein